MRKFIATSIFVLCILSCRARTHSTVTSLSDEDAAWVKKVADKLLLGRIPDEADDVYQSKEFKRDQYVDTLMTKEEFSLSVVEFHLKYLGLLKEDARMSLRSKDIFTDRYSLQSIVQPEPAILSAVLAIKNDQSLKSFFQWQQDIYSKGMGETRHLSHPVIKDGDPRMDDYRSNNDGMKKLALHLFENDFDTLFNKIFPTSTPKEICAKIDLSIDLRNASDRSEKFTSWRSAAEAFISDIDMNSKIDSFISGGLFFNHLANVTRECSKSNPNTEHLRDQMQQFYQKWKSLFAAYEKKKEKDGGLTFDALFPLKQIYPEVGHNFFFERYLLDIQNSSTNMNRRRGAYLLKTFFCDDLTPSEIAKIEKNQSNVGHHKNKHASDPACYACHYKLDPMSGFFKDHGLIGINFNDVKRFLIKPYPDEAFIFDDMKRLNPENLEIYQSQWLSEDPRLKKLSKWNVGFVRSAENIAENDYVGKDKFTLEDFFTIVRSAPEAKTCYVQRLAEYYISPSISFDPEWIADLAKNLDFNSPTSGRETKVIIKKLLLSESFKVNHPTKGECYDTKDKNSTLPCNIRYIINKNCASCHRATNNGVKIDFKNWTQISSNSGSFAIVKNGQKLSAKDSNKLILDSLTAKDQDRKMPPSNSMPDYEKDALYQFLKAQ